MERESIGPPQPRRDDHISIPSFAGNFSVPEGQVKKCLNHLRRARYGHVISIAGQDNISGAGKTTFASKLASSISCRDYFQFGVVWVSVGNVPSDDECLALIQMLTSQILDIAARNKVQGLCISTYRAKISSRSGRVSIQDCIDAIKDILQLAQVAQDHVESQKCLIVLDDIWDDRLVRLLIGLDAIILVTTRYSDIFADGKIPGTIHYLEPAGVEQKTKVLCKYAGLYEQATTIPPVALDVLKSARSLFEVNIYSHLMSGHMRDTAQLIRLWDRRKRDLVISGYHNKWITDYVHATWHGINLVDHVGSLTALNVSWEKLDRVSQLMYLLLTLCPPGIALSKQFLMLIWGITESSGYVAIVEILLAKNLLIAVYTDSERILHLHYLHYVFLKLAVLRMERPRIPGSLFCLSFDLGGAATSSDSIENVYNVIQSSADRIVSYLTSFTVLTSSSPAMMLPMWRSLILCSEIGILDTFEGPLVCLYRVTTELFEKNQRNRLGSGHTMSSAWTVYGDQGLLDYMLSASRVIEQVVVPDNIGAVTSNHGRVITEEDMSNMKNWYHFVLQSLQKESENSITNGRTSEMITDGGNPLRATSNNDIYIAVVLNKLGELYFKEGNLKVALDHHLRALKIFQSDSIHTDMRMRDEMSATFFSIANIYIRRGVFDEAAHIIQSVIRFKEGLYGTTCKDNAAAWFLLGDVFSTLERYIEALFAYDSSYHIYNIHWGASHTETVLAESAKSVAMIRSGDIHNGVHSLSKCVQFLLHHDFLVTDPHVASLIQYLPQEQQDKLSPSKIAQGDGSNYGDDRGNVGCFCGLLSFSSSDAGCDIGRKYYIDAAADLDDDDDFV